MLMLQLDHYLASICNYVHSVPSSNINVLNNQLVLFLLQLWSVAQTKHSGQTDTILVARGLVQNSYLEIHL